MNASLYTYGRHHRTCGVLKCSNCNFYTYSSEELTDQNHFLCRRSLILVIMLNMEKTLSNLQTHSKAEKGIVNFLISNKLRKNYYV